MIATVIQGKSYEQILALLDDPWIELAEIRLDLCELSDEEIEDLFANTDTPLIATCRGGDKEAERRLTLAIQSGARFADLELEADAGWSKRFRDLCHECGTEIIRSWHDFSGTPSLEYLQQIVARCYRYGADIAKVVTTAHSPEDCEAVLALYYETPLPANVAGARAVQNGGALTPAEPRRLVAFAMGEAGKSTRLECLRLGAPFSYAGLDSGGSGGSGKSSDTPLSPANASPAALGQYSFEEFHRPVYGGFRGFWRVGGDLPMPCSKSFAQRAILCAALAEGRSRLHGYTPCDDSESAIAVARALGANLRREADTTSDSDACTLVIDGIGASGQKTAKMTATPASKPGLPSKSAKNDGIPAEQATPATLHVGESGLLTRLCIPLLAAISDRPVTITGEKTLLQRPLKGVQNVMASFGVPIRSERVPITVTPPLIPGNAEVSGADGSQIISGLLTALPLCSKNSTLYISEPKSIPYMFITEDILRKFGVRVKSEMEGDERMLEEQDWSGCTQICFSIKGGQSYKAATLELEGDWSAAANFLVAGAIFGKAEVGGLNTDSLQADLAIADILVQAGAVVSEVPVEDGGAGGGGTGQSGEAGGMLCNVCVSKAPLEGFEADLANAPDLFPICSVLAAFCDGETTLHGVDRLHGKESDRAAAILEMMEDLGVECRVDGNDMFISGETLTSRLLNGRLLHGSGQESIAAPVRELGQEGIAAQVRELGQESIAAPVRELGQEASPRTFRTHGDHRIAMALKIASMGADSPLVMDDTACVAKSFPEFWELFDY